MKSIGLAYAAGAPEARAHYFSHFKDSSALRAQIDFATSRPIHTLLADSLKRSSNRNELSPSQKENLQALINGDGVAVITGQQPGLFLGPAYTLYKLISAIALASKLSKQERTKAVPIFWVQNQDHDFEEASQVSLLGSDLSVNTLRVASQNGVNSRRSIREQRLTSSLNAALDEFESCLGSSPFADEIILKLKECYQAESTLDTAFTKLISALFASYGVLIFDAGDPSVAPFTKEIYHQALEKNFHLHQLLSEKSKSIQSTGFQTQVKLRKNSPLFFLSSEKWEFARYRLAKIDEHYHTLGAGFTISEVEIRRELEIAPERFSPTALLRPIVQDFLFPTVATIGGLAELSYFAQLQPLYEEFCLRPSLIAPRAQFMILDQKSKQWLDEVALSAWDLGLSEQELISRLAHAIDNEQLSPNHLEAHTSQQLAQIFRFLEPPLMSADKTLKGAMDKAKEKMQYQVQSLMKRYSKALATRNEVRTKRINRLKLRCYPLGVEQERIVSSVYFLAFHGLGLLDTLIGNVKPLEYQREQLVI